MILKAFNEERADTSSLKGNLIDIGISYTNPLSQLYIIAQGSLARKIFQMCLSLSFPNNKIVFNFLISSPL